jgi:hypothetical protein
MHTSMFPSGHCWKLLLYHRIMATWHFLDIKKKGNKLKLMTLKENDVYEISS